jgi:hypothetical protein
MAKKNFPQYESLHKTSMPPMKLMLANVTSDIPSDRDTSWSLFFNLPFFRVDYCQTCIVLRQKSSVFVLSVKITPKSSITIWNFYIEQWDFYIEQWVFYIKQWRFYIEQWDFHIEQWVFDIYSWVFDIKQQVFDIYYWLFNIKQWVFDIYYWVLYIEKWGLKGK